ncbi:Interferon- developmental regulator 2 [Bulinus truncatus]|nr:Interferon- developmental regulator 2 [Bulinus truncatus]
MPKNKNTKRRGGGKSQDGAAVPPSCQKNEEDDESSLDQWSTQSVLSDNSSWHGSDPTAAGEESSEDTSQQELFEEKFSESMDGLLGKSAKSRIDALQGIQKALQKKYVADYLMDRKETLTENLVKCLRKSKGEELELVTACLGLVSVQLGSEACSLFDSVQPVLTTLMTDNSTPYKARGTCATTLATCCFLSSDDLEKTKLLTKALEDIFCLGYGKGENSPGVTAELSWLICQALSAWCLLLTIAPQYEVKMHISHHLGSLQDLLKNADVDLRITAGEAIALLYELARELDEDFEHEDEASLCELLKQLATDSVKHRAKKDRRQQRSCFRDVQRYVVDFESPSETVKLGKENILELNSWTQKRQYDTFCHVLMTGTSVHMKMNPILREMFDLGTPGLDDYSHTKSLSKAQRTFINAAAFKARTKARAKHRDKRAVTANGF